MKIPIEEKVLTTALPDASLKSDYLHPNAAGYHRLAKSIAALLKKRFVTTMVVVWIRGRADSSRNVSRALYHGDVSA